MFQCPCCGFEQLDFEPWIGDSPADEICPCCGFEFGFDDHSEGRTHAAYREKWIADGAQWFDEERKPADWNLQAQLNNLPQAST